MNRSKTYSRRAFTLIELLLVLVILAALAAVVVPRFASRGEQARITAARASIKNISTALSMFESDNGRLPTTEEGLAALIENPGDLENWHKYLDGNTVPRDPWGTPFQYKYPGDHNTDSYDLFSYGPNKQEGGDDDVTNWSD